MSRSLTLILGGARSGKSTYAEKLAAAHPGPVTYIATAQALDPEMATRIAAHQSKRPAHWTTLEIPLDLAAHLPPTPGGLVLLDCLTLFVSNVILRACPDLDNPDETAAYAALETELTALEAAMQASGAEWLVVSNEVGLGLVPTYPVGRIYRDALGWANQRLARRADRVIFMLAGVPMRLIPENAPGL
jgi:adenosylcobinamide kinase/adenosylcobinamide-phosphate guanylyltransferase